MADSEHALAFHAGGDEAPSALLVAPPTARALYVLGHGAGAGMRHPFMHAIAHALAARDVATFRYHFPYMEARRGRPDRTAVLLRTVRAAVAAAADALAGLPAFAGGKSMGGRMTSLAHAEAPLPGVRGLAFIGFPLHPAGRPGTERAAHLGAIDVPTLFLQGMRDGLADLALIRETTAGLGPLATLHVIDGADHGFHVLKRSGRTDADVIEELADTTAEWMRNVAG
jgi:uncharacterized protein